MPSQVNAGACPLFNTLDATPSDTSLWLKHTSLRLEPVPRAQLIVYHLFHSLTRFVLSPQLQAVYNLCCPLEQVSPLVSDRMTLPNQFMPCAPLAVSSPPWGGGGHVFKTKKKERGDVCAPRSFRPSTLGCLKASIKEYSPPFFAVPYSLRCCSLLSKEKKKRNYTRVLQMLRRLRRQWSSLMLLSRGALPAGSDVLMTAVSAYVGFLRSCASLCHLI